ncbi:MFS transporter [Achromobacter xylosoxidans]|uniref:MFS transporter n=1 Tax=Alcaligenes xylosoxydans xylosoxydans TaxID=85698 RepID=UPI0002EF8F98|nr:MFS transporter [Achromobacter xylosoxidans]
MPSRRTWALLASLYSTQFLGLMFFVIAMVAILREGGASLDTIGLVYLMGMAWPLKALYAPWIDRHATGLRGHYRGWLLATQAGLVLCLALIGLLDLRADFTTIYLLCWATALFSGAQDVALDGLACRVLTRPADRGFGNGLQIAGGLIGNLVGGGMMLMLYPRLGWRGCCLLLAALTAVSWLQLLGYREPQWPRNAGPASHARLLAFWRGPQRKHWLLVLLLYPASASLGYAVIMPSLLDTGWSLADIGLVLNVVGATAGLLVALAYGRLLKRWSRRGATLAAALLQAVGQFGGLALPAMAWGSHAAAAWRWFCTTCCTRRPPRCCARLSWISRRRTVPPPTTRCK